MNTTNEEPKATDNPESLKQLSEGCGAGCNCHSGGASCKARWGICAIVLIVAGVLVIRAMTKPDTVSTHAPAAVFADPVAASITTVGAAAEAPAGGASAPAEGELVQPAEASVGMPIGTFAELNTIAVSNDAVFVYLPGKNALSVKAPATPMQAAARSIETQGSKCALFTLKAGSPDYDKLATKMPIPSVLALVKGKGISAVSGDITETKLVQCYVAASSAGGCCGCGAGGCN